MIMSGVQIDQEEEDFKRGLLLKMRYPNILISQALNVYNRLTVFILYQQFLLIINLREWYP
jgi:hypothetical protein